MKIVVHIQSNGARVSMLSEAIGDPANPAEAAIANTLKGEIQAAMHKIGKTLEVHGIAKTTKLDGPGARNFHESAMSGPPAKPLTPPDRTQN